MTLDFEQRLLDGSADTAILNIHRIRHMEQLFQLHDYEVHHRHRKTVCKALVQRFKYLKQQQERE